MKEKKFQIRIGKRLPVLFTLILTFMAFGIDYLLAWRLENLLDQNPKEFTASLEADMCNALTNRNYFGVRIFLDATISKRIEHFALLSGECSRGSMTTVKISQKGL